VRNLNQTEAEIFFSANFLNQEESSNPRNSEFVNLKKLFLCQKHFQNVFEADFVLRLDVVIPRRQAEGATYFGGIEGVKKTSFRCPCHNLLESVDS